jgi:HAD superfamily, subfamily IIIB (Acid phosphatase)
MKTFLVIFAGLFFVISAAQAQTATPTSTSVDPRWSCDKIKDKSYPESDLGEPQNIDNFKKQLTYYRCTSYEGDVAKVLAAAEKWVVARAPRVAKPAIVLDIDETSLSNWPRIAEDDFAFIGSLTHMTMPEAKDGVPFTPDCGFSVHDVCADIDWQQKGLAQAIEPTLKLYKTARCIGVSGPCTPVDVFFVTGRTEREYNHEKPSAWTLRNLKAAGYADVAADHLYMRGITPDKGVSDYKTSKRIDIENRGYTIIASVGDQKSDLVGEHAEMTFKVPNPFYFIGEND